MFEGIDRVYVNERARRELGWQPTVDFDSVLERLSAGDDIWSPLAKTVGTRGYHDEVFADGPYPTVE